ncbi:Glycosyltransferase (GlcNAc) (modular protein) [Magnetospirillum sp. UT-4]|nr:Glycosyltransferase (GlcNAc) (modular protein) [Magnetospirillum sp. UT-4]
MVAKAAHPERVVAGILWQVVPDEDEDCVAVPAGLKANIRGIRVHANESQGACWARHRIQAELFDGEDYFLQIDSHSRFAPGWDDMLIAMLGRCPSPRPVLSTYPVGYVPPDTLRDPFIPVLVANRFNEAGILLLKSRAIPLQVRPERPLPTAFIGANCLFGPGTMVADVPYDPHLYFHGEEISLAVRLWTSGYDLFSPDDIALYHDYSPDRGRPRHWSDNRDWGSTNRRSFARARHILAGEPAPPEALVDIDRHGLGSARSLAEYEAFADVDFVRRSFGPRAEEGKFPPAGPPSALARTFTGIYRGNQWQNSETRSGPGSTRLVTQGMAGRLAALWQEMGIRTLVDAGCGDLNWMEAISDRLDLYLGADIVAPLIERNRQMFGHRANHLFTVADITRDRLPAADAVLCRHVLTHLDDALVGQALDLLRAGGSRVLIATTYGKGDNRPVVNGGWRPLDLSAPLFGLGPPDCTMVDGGGPEDCRLGVWRLRP